ncbi:MAG: sulfatase-like hydrolase/transferase, partial [Pirellulaceae bacterium]|nr:sulfatase-like hydrolase/transferase [Pirellulaceae bacterium]
MSKTLASVILLLTFFCSPLFAQEDRMGEKRPNVIFILSDDQSWDSFGFMGGKVHTPRLDQMAKDGL